MPLKPVFDKAPLTTMIRQTLPAGFVRMENAAMAKLYALIAEVNEPAGLEGAFRLACIVTSKPGEELVSVRIRTLLSAQKEDGSFPMSFGDSIALLRAAWAMYEYEARKPMLDCIARWCGYAVQHWDELMADDSVWAYSADLLELLENLYRVTGKAAVLTLCERVSTQTMGWSSVLNTINSQQPTSKTITKAELENGLTKETGSHDGYYNHLLRVNHAESLADGARSTMAKGWYSGSATELNATRNGWARLSRYHGAICGGLTSDELLEGTAPSALVSTAALGAWAEAICAAAMGDNAEWAYDALERMAFNAIPACIHDDKLLAFQRINSLTNEVNTKDAYFVSEDHHQHAMYRLARGYAALASSVVNARVDGADVNLYMPGRYAVPVEDDMLVFTIKNAANAVQITVHCKKDTAAKVCLRMPYWSRNTEVTVNGADSQGEVKKGMLTYDRTWHDGDVIVLNFEQTLMVMEGHHQGRYIMRGPVLMAMPVENDEWKKAFISANAEGNRVTVVLDQVREWKIKDNIPADVPVLPETVGNPASYTLMPYAKTAARIALFPGRKQA